MAVWQVVCGLCAVMCVAETRIRPEPFSSFKAPRGDSVVTYCVYGIFSRRVFDTNAQSATLGIKCHGPLISPAETILNYQTVSPLIEWTYHVS